MIKSVRSLLVLSSLTVAFLLLVVTACGGNSTSQGDDEIVDGLLDLLREENALHYAFGCVDFDGDVLADSPSLDEIAAEAGADPGSDTGVWESEASGIILGGGNQRSIVIHDPNSEPTNAEEFEERDVELEGGSLTCYIPK